MGEKKQKEQQVRTIYKVLAVAGCVLFVVLMIVSSMGTSWITAFKSVKPGDAVTIDITIRDKSGNPLVTSDQTLYRQLLESGTGLYFSRYLVVMANQSSTEAMIPIPVYSPNAGWESSFALFGGERDAISTALVGMRANEQKTITIPFTDSMTQTWSAEQLTAQGVNVTGVHIGDRLAMAVSDTESLAHNASESSYSVRLGQITGKNAESVTINFGYPTIDIKVVAIGETGSAGSYTPI